MSHLIYDGLVTVDNLGTEFDTSANPIVLKLDPTISKLPSGALKANVSGVVTGTNLSLNGSAPINLLPAIKAGETVTVMAYDGAAKKITYTNEAGTLVTIDLSSIAADIYTTVGNYDAATMTITLVDNDGVTPDITINLADLKKVVTSNSPSVSFTGTGEASSPLIATVTSIPSGVTLSPSQISPGTFPAGVITPAANIGPGPLPAATTIAPSQITAGALPANVTVPGGNITGVINPSVMTASTTHTSKWVKSIGMTRTVNGVASDQGIPTAVLADVLGYDASGTPSWESKAAFAGTLTIAASQIGAGTLGAGVTIPASQVTGQTVVNTVTDTPTGSTLVTTVNGVASAGINIPDNQTLALGGTLAAPTLTISNGNTVTFPGSNTFAITKAGGAVSTVNTIAATQAIPIGIVVDVIGFNAAGSPINQTVASLPIAPSQLTAGALPSTVTVSAASLPATTNTLAVTGPNLVSTVNGVAASVPMASIVPATAHVNTWTQATGLNESVNGVASNIAIPAGVPVNHLGYNLAGNPVYSAIVEATQVLELYLATAGSALLVITGPTRLNPYLLQWSAQTLIEVTAAGTTITLPVIPAAVSSAMIGIEFDIKTSGTWIGNTTVSAAATIDGAPTFTIAKTTAARQPSISARWTGAKWLIV